MEFLPWRGFPLLVVHPTMNPVAHTVYQYPSEVSEIPKPWPTGPKWKEMIQEIFLKSIHTMVILLHSPPPLFFDCQLEGSVSHYLIVSVVRNIAQLLCLFEPICQPPWHCVAFHNRGVLAVRRFKLLCSSPPQLLVSSQRSHLFLQRVYPQVFWLGCQQLLDLLLAPCSVKVNVSDLLWQASCSTGGSINGTNAAVLVR